MLLQLLSAQAGETREGASATTKSAALVRAALAAELGKSLPSLLERFGDSEPELLQVTTRKGHHPSSCVTTAHPRCSPPGRCSRWCSSCS